MIAWMLFVIALATFSGPAAGSPPAPATLGQGVTVTPAPGWDSAQNVWNVGPNAISLQHAGVLAAFGSDSYGGTTQQLLDDQLAGVQQQFAGGVQEHPPAVGGDV